jgi:seryl-tRNA synthetase
LSKKEIKMLKSEMQEEIEKLTEEIKDLEDALKESDNESEDLYKEIKKLEPLQVIIDEMQERIEIEKWETYIFNSLNYPIRR